MNKYVEALRREAAGYIDRGATRALEAVNRELRRVGEKPVEPPAAPKRSARDK